MKRLSDQEYQNRKREELEGQFRSGDLDENMEPYLEWLRGDRNRAGASGYHEKAQKLVRELHEDYSLAEIAREYGFSYSSLQRLHAGDYNQVSTGYAKRVYEALYSRYH